MTMINSAFHKLCQEFDLNYNWNDAFRQYCDESGIMYTNSYGIQEASGADMKQARTVWKNAKRLWFRDSGDVDTWLDCMPFGGYKSELDAINAIKRR